MRVEPLERIRYQQPMTTFDDVTERRPSSGHRSPTLLFRRAVVPGSAVNHDRLIHETLAASGGHAPHTERGDQPDVGHAVGQRRAAVRGA